MSSKRIKQNIKKGDFVIVIAGADKNLTRKREVLDVLLSKQRVVVDGVALKKKHQKATENSRGGIIEMNGSIHISNVMLVDPKDGGPTRIGRKEEDGKSVRYSKRSGEIIS